MVRRVFSLLVAVVFFAPAVAAAQTSSAVDPFAPIALLLPPPDGAHLASGAPGPDYWQQQVDYRITARLDEPGKLISGTAEISYHNNAPHALDLLWLLLDQNRFRPTSLREETRGAKAGAPLEFAELARQQRQAAWAGGFTITGLSDGQGRSLKYQVVDALMRIDLPRAIPPGGLYRLRISWTLPIIETRVVGGRSGYDCLAGDARRCIFQLAQWFPRLAAYDAAGWHNDPFLGIGEFALEYGDYDVSLTVPADHVVAATGTLQNPAAILSPMRRERLARARDAASPVMIVTAQEAQAAERDPARDERTWHFTARHVRDFAVATSRRYLWDAMGVRLGDGSTPPVLAMSYYPDEARPLWPAYATKALAHALRVQGAFLFPYPYPVVQAAYGQVSGYENPMLAFVDGGERSTDAAGAAVYGEGTKRALISTLFHEAGHNWLPETINIDERRDAWMDEGINGFLQFETEKRWDAAYPARGEPRSIAGCMTATAQSPIMTRPDFAVNAGCIIYRKPQTALIILRETVLGREAFDNAFRAFGTRWQGKRATPADFFRTMGQVSGVDLDWFWRGWFFGTGHVDIALDGIAHETPRYKPAEADDAGSTPPASAPAVAPPPSLTALRNAGPTAAESDPALRDFFDSPAAKGALPPAKQPPAASAPTPAQRQLLERAGPAYRFTFRNVGGLISPIPLKLSYADGSTERMTIPVQVWRAAGPTIGWRLWTRKTLTSAEIDPDWETGDTDRGNNLYKSAIAEVALDVAADEGAAPTSMERRGFHVTPDSLQPIANSASPSAP